MKLKIAAALLLMATCSSAQTTRPASLDLLRPFLGGEWKTEGKWANGNPLRAVMKFDWLLAEKHLRAEGFTVDEAGNQQPRDVSIFSIAEGQLVQHVFAADGNARRAVGHVAEDGAIVFEWSRPNADGSATALKQIIRLVDQDTAQQQFLMHIRGEWHTLLDTTWHRQK